MLTAVYIFTFTGDIPNVSSVNSKLARVAFAASLRQLSVYLRVSCSPCGLSNMCAA